ncbi:MAG: class I SAM-dependent methyltransferase [Mesorhizobium sp.]|nr:MAG: class I SAM-dependent methyltransferase [Mesorhizobium sp.]
MNNTKEQFSKIYIEHAWGGTSKSGPGSDPEVLQTYSELLVDYIKRKGIRSVVDVGCGDWALGRTLDWTGVDYTGVDIVPELIEKLNDAYGSSNVRFACLDLLSDPLPTADLCVIKDVLQHLSNDSVNAFLAKLQKQFKASLITNDITHTGQGGWRVRWRAYEGKANSDISNGGYRPLRLTEEPFNLNAKRLATIPLQFKRAVFGHPGTVKETKEVLLWLCRKSGG